MKLIKWFVKDNESVIGTKNLPTLRSIESGNQSQTDVILIGFTPDNEIALGLSFGKVPSGAQEVISSKLQENFYILNRTVSKIINEKKLTKAGLSTFIKYLRQQELDKLTIKVVGKNQIDVELDANELSQDRLNRAKMSLEENEEIIWKMTNNEFTSLNMSMINNALKMAGAKQSALWVKYSF